jgi:hypothetical protein
MYMFLSAVAISIQAQRNRKECSPRPMTSQPVLTWLERGI